MTSMIAILLGTGPTIKAQPPKTLSGSRLQMANSSHAKHQATVERVYEAIKAGKNTAPQILEATELGIGAVRAALQTLEMPHPEPRIKRFKTKPAHTFEVIK